MCSRRTKFLSVTLLVLPIGLIKHFCEWYNAIMNNSYCFTKDTLTRKPTKSGDLDGLLFAVKDLISIKNHISSFGSRRWRETHQAADHDSSILTNLLNAGAELFGITKMDQLAYSIIGNIGEDEAPININYPKRFCGGSSSGSASAVASGIVDFAIGSDTGGSIRVPAAACGIYGLRTSFDCLPTDGVSELAKSADVLGFFANKPEILSRLMSIFTVGNSKSTIFKRLLLPQNIHNLTSFEVEAIGNYAHVIAKNKDLIIETFDESKFVSNKVRELFARTQSREIWRAHGIWAKENLSYLAKEVQDRFAICEELSMDSQEIIESDLQDKDDYNKKLKEFIGYDGVMCLPILGIEGPNRSMTDEELLNFRSKTFILAAPSSLSGLPQISAPVPEFSTNIGLIGPKGSDLALVDLVSNETS